MANRGLRVAMRLRSKGPRGRNRWHRALVSRRNDVDSIAVWPANNEAEMPKHGMNRCLSGERDCRCIVYGQKRKALTSAGSKARKSFVGTKVIKPA